jgi:hypothetical protein
VRGVAGRVRAHYRAQCRTFGGDEAAPDAVLADVPVPERERQARVAYRAAGADGDRRGCFLTGLLDPHAHGEPLFGIMAAVRAAGMPDDAGPQGLVGERPGDRKAWPSSHCPVRGSGSRRGILRSGGTRNSHRLSPSRTSVQREARPPAKLPRRVSVRASACLTAATRSASPGFGHRRRRSAAPGPRCVRANPGPASLRIILEMPTKRRFPDRSCTVSARSAGARYGRFVP